MQIYYKIWGCRKKDCELTNSDEATYRRRGFFSTQYGRTIHPASSEPLPAMVGTFDAYRPNL